jgi:hypothetical protein
MGDTRTPSPLPTRAGPRGTTLVELIASLVVASLLVLGPLSVFHSLQQGVPETDPTVAMEQNARLALEFLVRDLRLAGLHADRANGQPIFIDLAPYQVVFNADIVSNSPGPPEAAIVDPTLPSDVLALPAGAIVPRSGAQPTYVAPSLGPQAPAETIRYSCDRNGDLVVDTNDADPSFNPFDFALMRSVNDGMVEAQLVAFGIRGVATDAPAGTSPGTGRYPNGDFPLPLFQYWIEGIDPSGGCGPPTQVEVLWGDASADGFLSSAELESLHSNSWKGAIVLDGDGDNDEDDLANGVLDPGEDCNGNGLLDHNLLDLHLTRILVTTTAAAAAQDPSYVFAERSKPECATMPDAYDPENPVVPNCYRFHERAFRAAIAPRIAVATSLFPCPGWPPPFPPPAAPVEPCTGVLGRTSDPDDLPVSIEWVGAPDGPGGEDGVIGYAIYRDSDSRDPERRASEDNHLSWHVTTFSHRPPVAPTNATVSVRVLRHTAVPPDPCSGGTELFASASPDGAFDLRHFGSGFYALCVDLAEGQNLLDSLTHVLRVTANRVPALSPAQGLLLAFALALAAGRALRGRAPSGG